MVRTTHSHKSVRRHDKTDANESGLEKDRYFQAGCPGIIVVRDLVYITGPAVGGVFQSDKVDPTARTKMVCNGIVIEKLDAGTKCLVMRQGQLDGFSGLTPNDPLFVGLDGRPTQTAPDPPLGGIVFIQIIGHALDNTVAQIDVRTDGYIRRG